MTNNSKYVSVAKPAVAGCVHAAPAGTTLPTSATEALDSAFVNVGYISTDGIKRPEERNTTVFHAFGGDAVATASVERTEKVKFTMIETTKETLSIRYGKDNVLGENDGTLKVEHNSKDLDELALVFDFVLKGGRLKRVVAGNAVGFEFGEESNDAEDLLSYEVTMLCQAFDSSGNTTIDYYSYPAE